MKLEKITGVSKKTNKEYTGYVIKIGEYSTPMFFPSKIEEMYIQDYLKNLAHKDFQNED